MLRRYFAGEYSRRYWRFIIGFTGAARLSCSTPPSRMATSLLIFISSSMPSGFYGIAGPFYRRDNALIFALVNYRRPYDAIKETD